MTVLDPLLLRFRYPQQQLRSFLGTPNQNLGVQGPSILSYRLYLQIPKELAANHTPWWELFRALSKNRVWDLFQVWAHSCRVRAWKNPIRAAAAQHDSAAKPA